MKFKNQIMTDQQMDRSLSRIAHEILERNKNLNDVVIIGIQRRGVSLAKIIADKIEKFEGVKLPVGILDITLYRDDLPMLSEPIVKDTKIDFPILNKDVILVDDVLFTGRTIYASLAALKEFGRAKSIQLAVLIDRGHREMPIRPDYVGKNIPTSRNESIAVNVIEFDNENSVNINLLDE